ncbi:hypothetical protein ANN_11764 [Periplaneta americana]|uniref:DUF4371 domain-containing protein n=1 Tax=Periplaneta americana TaxID=6978 RepID=A0ABQ8T7C5_PERAM|nr:hypothetical protein ANN_11764 [Periplaneta americana]
MKRVKGEEMSEASEIGRRVRQECPLSRTLFNIYLEDLVKTCFQNMGGKKDHLLRISGERTKEETSEVLCVECSIVWGAETWALLRANKSIWNVDMEKAGTCEMDRVRNEAVLERVDDEKMMLKFHDKNIDVFDRKRRELLNSQEFLAQSSYSTNEKATEASFIVSYRVAQAGAIEEDMLIRKPLPANATGSEIFRLVSEYFEENHIPWVNCVHVCTDGAKAMVGKTVVAVSCKKLVAKMQNQSFYFARQALAISKIPEYCDSDVRFELTTSVPQERRSRGALWDGARRRGERANAAREWRESARASGAGREERALDFSGVPSLETRGTFEATKEASLVYRSSTRVCVRNCVSSRRPEFECSGPQLGGPEFECSGPQLEGPEFEYSELSLKNWLPTLRSGEQEVGRQRNDAKFPRKMKTLYIGLNVDGSGPSRPLRWAGHVARMGESRNAYSVLVGRPEGKRPLGRPRRRWENNIKVDLREVGYDDREWINLAQDRDRWRAYVRTELNLRVP